MPAEASRQVWLAGRGPFRKILTVLLVQFPLSTMLKWKYHAYDLLKFVWLALAMGTTIFVFTGMAEPYIPPPPIPSGYIPPAMFIVGGALAYAGFYVLRLQNERLRRTAWRRANLRPTEEGDFQGTVRGRSVRVRTDKWRDPKEDTNNKSATVIEAQLRRPAEEGFVIDTSPSAKLNGLSEADSSHILVEDDAFAVVGVSEGRAQSLISGRSREALLGVRSIGKFRVGASSTLFRDPVGAGLGSIFGEESVETGPGEDASTVTHKLEGTILKPEKLKRQVDAVAAVANAFEKAVADTRAE